MRRALTSAVLGVLFSGALASPAVAAPATPQPAPASSRSLPVGWQLRGNELTWHAPAPAGAGPAAVEFYAGARLLGRPDAAADLRTFRLRLTDRADLAALADSRRNDLQARAGGRRLDAEEPRRAVADPVTPTLPANPVDPGVKGPYATITGEYHLDDVTLPDLKTKVEMQAVVVAPAGASGQLPLALFLHGRYYTCFVAQKGVQQWPCPAGTEPIPSYRGFRRSQELLASQGYVTVSISANGISAQDVRLLDNGTRARSALIRRHLTQWAAWMSDIRTAPAIVRQSPRADLSKVLLVGHSRGGEGVNRAAIDSLAPGPGDPIATRWQIQGMLLIAPTAYGQNPAPDVPSAVILPGCDYDVYRLEGQTYVDGTRGVSNGRALHGSLYVVGANHNFWNSVWEAKPIGDDWPSRPDSPDPVCEKTAPSRLTAAQQQQVGATYAAAAARLFIQGDDRVRPLLDGSGRRAPSADPARVYNQAIGGARQPVIEPATSLGLTGATLCKQVDTTAEACLDAGVSPHFAPLDWVPNEPGRYAVKMAWDAPGTPIKFRPAQAATVSGYDALALRMVVAPGTGPVRFGVAVTGTDGRRTVLDDIAVESMPATTDNSPFWSPEVRVALRGLGTVATLELIPRTASGRAWLIDAWGWRPETQTAQPATLPRVDIGRITEPEGDGARRTLVVPVTFTGSGNGRVRLFTYDPESDVVVPTEVVVNAQTTTVKIPIWVTPDTKYDVDRQYPIVAKAITGVAVGDYVGGVVLENDDPLPAFTVTPGDQTVPEAGGITYEVSLPAALQDAVFVGLEPIAPATGPELTTADVDPDWFLFNAYGEEVLPDRPLSQTGAVEWTSIEPGTLTATITVPTVADGVTEPAEHLRARLLMIEPDQRSAVPAGPVVTATVTD
ncbi:hypothetical protein [Paractinoplanes ferrugineus]|uniref:hypothetical protein n=1 Tax=Paractinoplanes ferrugineus TaxID=113564 RepID=UPI001943D79F|nr:hypothetical protein [Actinoplanes ferrugineus]